MPTPFEEASMNLMQADSGGAPRAEPQRRQARRSTQTVAQREQGKPLQHDRSPAAFCDEVYELPTVVRSRLCLRSRSHNHREHQREVLLGFVQPHCTPCTTSSGSNRKPRVVRPLRNHEDLPATRAGFHSWDPATHWQMSCCSPSTPLAGNPSSKAVVEGGRSRSPTPMLQRQPLNHQSVVGAHTCHTSCDLSCRRTEIIVEYYFGSPNHCNPHLVEFATPANTRNDLNSMKTDAIKKYPTNFSHKFKAARTPLWSMFLIYCSGIEAQSDAVRRRGLDAFFNAIFDKFRELHPGEDMPEAPRALADYMVQELQLLVGQPTRELLQIPGLVLQQISNRNEAMWNPDRYAAVDLKHCLVIAAHIGYQKAEREYPDDQTMRPERLRAGPVGTHDRQLLRQATKFVQRRRSDPVSIENATARAPAEVRVPRYASATSRGSRFQQSHRRMEPRRDLLGPPTLVARAAGHRLGALTGCARLHSTARARTRLA